MHMQMFRRSTEEQVPKGHQGQTFRILKERKLILNQHRLNVKWHGARLSAAAPKLSHTAAGEPTSSANAPGEQTGMGPTKKPKTHCINKLSSVTGNDKEKSMKCA